MNEKQTMEYIESLNQYGSVLGLENMVCLLNLLGNPQEELSFVHIAGTNGKGSVLAYVSTILYKAGYKVGRYVSPTVVDYRERIQINGKMISKKDLCVYVELLKNACDQMVQDGKPHPTPFEVETAMAFVYFAKKQCDIVVLETGLGGRLDATNVIRNTITSVITSVSMDHMAILGNSLEKIANEKCGIIKENSSLVTLKQKSEVEKVIIEFCDKLNCELIISDKNNVKVTKSNLEKQVFCYKTYKNLEISLVGQTQIENVALAIDVIETLQKKGYTISEKALRQGLKETKWHGRFEVLAKKPYFIVDGAHNEDAAEKLAHSIQFYFTNKRIIYIMGVLRDKEYEKVIQKTYSYASHIITVTPPKNPRALPAYDLALTAKDYHDSVTVADSLEEAVEMAYLLSDKDSVIITFGSLSYLGRIMEIIEKREKSRSDTHGRQRKS